MFASATYAATKQRRLRAIARRATPELSEAFSQGELSLRRTELLSKLSPARQRQILAKEQRKEDAQRLAAQALHDFLAQEKGRIDLKQVARRIVETIRQ
jgi:hypothetical protein